MTKTADILLVHGAFNARYCTTDDQAFAFSD